MITNKRGLSAVVVTLIMILLGIVVAGIIWVVVQNVIQTGVGQIDLSTDCMAINLEISSVVCNEVGTECSTTVERRAGGKEIAGIDLIYGNPLESVPIEHEENIAPNTRQTFPDDNPGVANITNVRVIPYFEDDSGNKMGCPNPSFIYQSVNLID